MIHGMLRPLGGVGRLLRTTLINVYSVSGYGKRPARWGEGPMTAWFRVIWFGFQQNFIIMP